MVHALIDLPFLLLFVGLANLPISTSLVSVPLISSTSWALNNSVPTATTWSRPQLGLQQPPSQLGLQQPMPGVLSTAVSNTYLSGPHAYTTPGATVQPWQVPPSASGFSLSPASQPFPQKLVDKVRSGQFVEMRDLLADNMALMQQVEAFSSHCTVPALPGVLKPRLREVSSLASWMYCFLAYVAMRAPDQETRNFLAYARLLIREAGRHGGSAWIDYDRVFRQQAALDHTLQWNTLHPGIQAATLIGRGGSRAALCTLCREPDHPAEQCALTYLQQPVAQVTTPTATRSRPRFRQRPVVICKSFNRGQCIRPETCNYEHECTECHSKEHGARDCPNPCLDPSGHNTGQRKPGGRNPGRSQPSRP